MSYPKPHLTRREREVLQRMVEIESDDEGSELYRQGSSYWIDADRCTRTALNLIRKGLVQEDRMDEDSGYLHITSFGRRALSDPDFIPPTYYLYSRLPMPEEAKRALDPTRR